MALFGFWRKYWGRTDKAPEWRPPENGRSGDEDRQAGRYQFVYRFVPLFAQPIRMPQPGDLQQDLENSVGKIKSSNEISKNSRISSLLKNLGLECRLYDCSKKIDVQADEYINYELVDKKRKIMIKESVCFLDEAIGSMEKS